jgi:hypothetical protein
MADLAVLVLTLVAIVASVVAAWASSRAGEPMPHDMLSWKGVTPDETAFRAARRRDGLLAMVLTLLTALCGLVVAVLAYYRP